MHEPNDQRPVPFFAGKESHDYSFVSHSGLNGHYCHGNDGLYICDDCNEKSACRCFEPKPFACGLLGNADQLTMFDAKEPTQ